MKYKIHRGQEIYIFYESIPRQNSLRLLCRNIQNIISSYKGIAKFCLKLATDILFRLFENNIHISIKFGQNATIIYTRVQFNYDWSANNSFNKVLRRVFIGLVTGFLLSSAH